MSQQQILIIGGSGFLSGTLARAAVTRGHRVWAVTRGQRSLPAGVIGLTVDRHDEAAFEQVISAGQTRWDLVIDCIAYRPADIRQDIALFRTRADHFVFVSTDFVFDPGRRRFPQAEESDHYLTEGYGGQKRQSELALLEANPGDMAWTIVRPCHIYGPGSQLGCLPEHGRDASLLDRLRSGQPLRLVGNGHFLQQPILARNLADLILDLARVEAAYGQIFGVAGPDMVESRHYYQIIADILGVPLQTEELPVAAYLSDHPEAAPFLCHRIYDLSKLQASGLPLPATPLEQGLQEHVASLMKG